MSPEERFARYIAAFAAQDYVSLVSFYDPEVRLTIGTGQELVGRDAIAAFYGQVNRDTRREIRIVDCFADGDRLAAELESEFVALRDAPRFPSGPMLTGDRLRITSFAFYQSRNGLYFRVRAAVFRREWLRA